MLYFYRNASQLWRRQTPTKLQNIIQRTYAATPVQEFVRVEFDEDKRFGRLIMQRPPVNSLNLDLIQSLISGLDLLEKQKCRGLILTSNLHVFSAGLDLTEMIKPQEERYRTFRKGLQDLWKKLFLSPMATVALINGHSPAGGCLLAMSCDYRVMIGEKSRIGLNEAQLGLTAQFWFRDTMSHIISPRQTELALSLGTLFSGKEALKIKLIDELVNTREEGEAAAIEQLKKYSQINEEVLHEFKILMRQEIVDKLNARSDSDVNDTYRLVKEQKIQDALQMYVEQLKNKKNK